MRSILLSTVIILGLGSYASAAKCPVVTDLEGKVASSIVGALGLPAKTFASVSGLHLKETPGAGSTMCVYSASPDGRKPIIHLTIPE